jgi:hypothetical protein
MYTMAVKVKGNFYGKAKVTLSFSRALAQLQLSTADISIYTQACLTTVLTC